MIGDIGYSDVEMLRFFHEKGYAMEEANYKDCPVVVTPEAVVSSTECLGTCVGTAVLVPIDESSFRYLGNLTVAENAAHSEDEPVLLNHEMLREWFYCAMETLNRNIDDYLSRENNQVEDYMCVFRRHTSGIIVYGPMLCFKKGGKFVTYSANGKKKIRTMESDKHLVFDRHDQAQYDKAIDFIYRTLENDPWGNPWHEETSCSNWLSGS